MILVILWLLLAVTCGTAAAAPIINEISPRGEIEWVELFNPDADSYDVSGWVLKDNNQNTGDDISLSGVLDPGGYIVFTHEKGWLNDGGDTVTLVASTSAEVDRVEYGVVHEDSTYARIPDDSENWSSEAMPTQGLPNPAPAPSPSMVPSPSPSPMENSSPSPRQSSSPAIPSPSPSVRPSSLASLSPPSESLHEASTAGVSTFSGEVDLSAFTRPSPLASPVPPIELAVNRERAQIVMIIGSGLVITGAASFVMYRRYKCTV